MFKVLIAEDEDMLRRGLHYTYDWSKEDCVVVGEAKNGEEGLRKIRDLNPDIVIVDINMPIMNGLKMIQNSINEYKYSAIILTGYDEFNFAKEAIHLGVAEYLLKPVDNDKLSESLKKAKDQVRQNKYLKMVEENTRDLSKLGVLQMEMNSDERKWSKCVGEMIDYIEKNYNKKISIEDLTDTIGFSSTYLNQKFKLETSYTFNDYLNRYRINKAISMMKLGGEKIYNIATEVGFKDYRYFISVFKKYTDCLPSDFIEYFRN